MLYLLRKRLAAAGITAEISLAAISAPEAMFDPETEVVQSVDLQMLLEQIKLDLAKEKGCSEEEEQERAEREQERLEEERERLAEEEEEAKEEE